MTTCGKCENRRSEQATVSLFSIALNLVNVSWSIFFHATLLVPFLSAATSVQRSSQSALALQCTTSHPFLRAFGRLGMPDCTECLL